MLDYCKECPCYGCPFDVCGCGSEVCSASVGDYCQRISGYIKETEEDREFLEELQKKFSIFSSL